MLKPDLITIIGPTASGKTALACKIASILQGEIISGDSRQVYRGMDIGTGKDLSEYIVNEKYIRYHLIDIYDAGYKYNIYQYQHDFFRVYTEIKERNNLPVLCGGSGLYVESVLRGYNLIDVPEDKQLRKDLSVKSLQELSKILTSYKELHNTTDIDTVQRAIRAIEIEEYKLRHITEISKYPPLDSLIIGIDIDRDHRRKKISKRLRDRLEEGMIEEVRNLLDRGLSEEDLIYYGLEYKYVTQYIIGRLSFEVMLSQLEIAIHQFAKRQMTWFRGMEKRGLIIHWIDAALSDSEKMEQIESLYNSFKKDRG